jgi:ankyrin repeat protein
MDCVKLLLNHGANPLDVTQDGWNALHCSVSRGKHPVVSLYLAYGIPVDGLTRKRKTPLHYAAYMGSAATISVLVKVGAFIDAPS